MAGAARLLVKCSWPVAYIIEPLLTCCKYNSTWILPIPLHTPTPTLLSSRFKFQPSLQFRQFNPPRQLIDPKLLQKRSKRTFDFLNGFPKSFFFRKRDNKKRKKRVPKLILVQNPFTWLMLKIDFSVLRNIWDPTFIEKEFKFGTKQAISRITQVISQGQYAELNGLLTKAARQSLLRELERNWNERQRSLLALHRDDIQISSPRKVYFIRIADKKFCDVDMAFLALKWTPINSIDALIFTEIFARFHREYTPHSIPEWTIAYFKVTRFEVLRR
ncbi:m-AAA protease-interacting protein 1, mitochondrial [Achroia grisella]|uniref:m-AAA protease-interacting protein 1, mitochondrial n=1 Tax=Achroia grisella TaxID=688607 RepID=UPI0027D1F006|nr:m-AAA protease-interacting protein 1, mitochondrial [Achroia grisella]